MKIPRIIPALTPQTPKRLLTTLISQKNTLQREQRHKKARMRIFRRYAMKINDNT